MNLFDMNENTRQLPLASRMRPEKLDEIVGQLHIIGKDKLLYRAIKGRSFRFYYFNMDHQG